MARQGIEAELSAAAVEAIGQAELPSELRKPLSPRNWLRLPVIWLSGLTFCGGVGLAAFLWLATMPSLLSCDRQRWWVSHEEHLICAEQAVRNGDLESVLAGLKLVAHWSPHHKWYSRANQRVQEWSAMVLHRAYEHTQDDQWMTAIALAGQIPPTSSLSGKAGQAIATWRQQHWEQQQVDRAIQAAIKAQDWLTAETQLTELIGRKEAHWRRFLLQRRHQLLTERLARQQLQQIRLFAAAPGGDRIRQLAQAIFWAKQLPHHSYTQVEAAAAIDRWGQELLTIAATQLVQNNQPAALATLQALPTTTPLTPDLAALVAVHQTEQLLGQPISHHPTQQHQLLPLLITLTQISYISTDALVYAQAQTQLPKLQAQVQDLLQLQVAQAISAVRHPNALDWATQLAAVVTPERPRYLQAQILIATWQHRLHPTIASPQLLLANQLAQAGTPEMVQTAIAYASQIPLGHPQRKSAQAAIFAWKQQFPMLTAAPIGELTINSSK
jgi:hypothetical protein